MVEFALVVCFSCAIGTGLIANIALSSTYELGRRWFYGFARRGRRLNALGLGKKEEGNTEQLLEEEVLGLPKIPWTGLYVGSAFVGISIFLLLGSAMSGLKWFFLALPAIAWLTKRFFIHQQKRFMVGKIRQLLLDIRLQMSLNGSLLLGLASIAENSIDTSAVYHSLQRRMSGGSGKNGLDILRQIAEDLKSPHLQRITRRIYAANQSGGILDVDSVIAGSIDELNEEISNQAEEQMQRLPLRITLLAMPFLLGPIVILLFYPLVDRILKTLSGVAVGGGF